MIADGYDAFLFDLDGVLFRGSVPIPGAADAVRRLRALGRSVAFVTNNSSRTPDEVAAHLAMVGIDADPAEIETSALSTAQLLRDRAVASAFVVGEEGLRTALADVGIGIRDGEPPHVDVVVVGYDRGVDYAKLRTASVLVQRGAALVGSNPDTTFPAEDGTSWPGAGALLAVIELTTGRRAEVVGKPNAPIFRAALRRAGGTRPLVIGDRIDTDIVGAGALGWDSMLVLTGISARSDAATAGVSKPTYVADDLDALFRAPAEGGP